MRLEVCDLYLWCLRDGIRMEVVHNGLGQVQAASVRAFFEVALPGLHGVHSNLVDNRDLPCWKFVLTKAAGHVATVHCSVAVFVAPFLLAEGELGKHCIAIRVQPLVSSLESCRHG